MAEATQYMFKHKDLVELLIKEVNVHEGIWGLTVNLGFGAANMGSSQEMTDLNPTALIPVLGIGIQRVNELTNMSVDAAIVNPKE